MTVLKQLKQKPNQLTAHLAAGSRLPAHCIYGAEAPPASSRRGRGGGARANARRTRKTGRTARSVGEGHGVARELDRLLLEEGAEHEVLEAEVALAPRLARGRLLRDEARRGEHAQPAVRELLRLHLAQLGRVGRLEAERIEVQVARHVPRLQRLHVGRVLLRVGPADLDAVRLADADAERADEPEPRGQLRDLLDR